MLMNRDKEIMGLKQELLKVRAASEQEVKKFRKTQGGKGGLNSTVIMTTNGSNEPSNLDYSFDPYSGGARKITLQDYNSGRDPRHAVKKRPNLNSTMVESGDFERFNTDGFDSEMKMSSGRQSRGLFS